MSKKSYSRKDTPIVRTGDHKPATTRRVDGIGELREDDGEESTPPPPPPSDIRRRRSLDKQRHDADDSAGGADDVGGRRGTCPTPARGEDAGSHGDGERTDERRQRLTDDEHVEMVLGQLPALHHQHTAAGKMIGSGETITSVQRQVTAPVKPTRRLTGLHSYTLTDDTRQSPPTNSRLPDEPGRVKVDDDEQPTRPWSADEYDGQSTGQFTEHSSPRIQSADDAADAAESPVDDVVEMSGRWSSRSTLTGSATGRRPRAFTRRDTPRTVHISKRDRGFTKHVSLTTPASLFEEGDELHDAMTAAAPAGLRRSMTTDDAQMTSYRACHVTMATDRRATNGDDTIDIDSMTLRETESEAPIPCANDAILSRDDSESRDQAESRDRVTTTTTAATTSTGAGARPKTTKILQRKNTPAVLPKIDSLYSPSPATARPTQPSIPSWVGTKSSSSSSSNRRSKSLEASVVMEEEELTTSLMTTEDKDSINDAIVH